MTLLPDPTVEGAEEAVEAATRDTQKDAMEQRSLTVQQPALMMETGSSPKVRTLPFRGVFLCVLLRLCGRRVRIAIHKCARTQPLAQLGCAEEWSELDQSIFFKLFFVFGDR
jgi:hypothetical protein